MRTHKSKHSCTLSEKLLKFSNIRAVLFDLDETLIDSSVGLSVAHLAVARELFEYMKKKRIKVNLENILEKIKMIDDSMNLILEYDRDKWWQILLNKLNIEHRLKPEFKKILTSKYWSSYADLIKPYDDAISTLKHLKSKGYLLGLITDTDGVPGYKKARIKKLAFSKIFDAIIIAGEDTKDTKPNPEPYLMVAKLLKVSPNECVFVGDKPFTDIEGAFRAGMKAILVYRRKWNRKKYSNPDLIVNDLNQLRAFL